MKKILGLTLLSLCLCFSAYALTSIPANQVTNFNGVIVGPTGTNLGIIANGVASSNITPSTITSNKISQEVWDAITNALAQ